MTAHKRIIVSRKFLIIAILLNLPGILFCQDFIFTYTGPDTIFVGSDCSAALNWGHPNTPTAESNIPGAQVDSFYIFSISGGYQIDDAVSAGKIVEITYKAVDDLGNEDFFTFDIDFIDNTPPEFVNPADDLIVECDETVEEQLQNWYDNYAGAQAMDNCGEPLIVADPDWPTTLNLFNESMNSLCGNTGIVTVSFTTVDTAGNANSTPTTATFRSQDTEGPEIVVNPMDLSIPCDTAAQRIFNLWIDNVGGAQAADPCSDTITWTSFVWTDVNGNSGTGIPGVGPYIDIDESFCDWSVSISFIVVDECENLNATIATTFQVIDTVAPQFLLMPQDLTIGCDNVPLLASIPTFDDCLGPSFSVGEETSTQSDNPEDCKYYEYDIIRTWQAVDSCGNESSLTQQITVVDTLTPSYIAPVDVTIDCADLDNPELAGFPEMVEDNCVEEPIIEFTDEIDSTLCNGIITRTWLISDYCENSSTHVQTITVIDTIDPVILFEANDRILHCDSEESFEASFQDWLLLAGEAQATDECEEVMWFAAVPGSYVLDDPSTYPGESVGNLDGPDCNSEDSTIIRYEEVDFVFFDMCGNSALTSAKFAIIDSVPPEVIDCPTDTIVISTLPGQCEGLVQLNPPFAMDNCANSDTIINSNQSINITSQSPGDDGVPVDSTSIGLSTPGLNNSPAIGGVTLVISFTNIDADDFTEYFTILGEDGTEIGQSPTGIELCGDTTIQINDISPEQLNAWGTDGMIEFFLNPNIPADNDTLAISDICGGTSVQFDLQYEVSDNQHLRFSYRIDGGEESEGILFESFETTIPQGLHYIEYIYRDCGENLITCKQYIEVLDNEPPVFNCPEDLTFILSDDQCIAFIGFPIDYSYTDNCAAQDQYERILPDNPEDELIVFNFNEDVGNFVAADKTFVYNDASSNAYGEDVMLELTIRADGESEGEHFNILGDDGQILGSTAAGTSNMDTVACDSISTLYFFIPVETFNIWAIDGVVNITAESIYEGGDGINPCNDSVNGSGQTDGHSFMRMRLSYDIVIPSYYTEGATVIERKEFPSPAYIPVEDLNVGKTTVYYIFEDGAGNADSCSFDIDVVDISPPVLECEPVLEFIHPSGLIPINLEPEDVYTTAFDNCGIDSISLEPNTFTCEFIHQEVPVTLTAIDSSGNESICETTVRIEAQVLEPTYSQDICQSDTLFLFANAPDAPSDSVYTFEWEGPNNFSSQLENPIIPSVDATNNGTYSLTITGFDGCYAMGTVEVFIEDLASPEVVPEQDIVCHLDDLILNATMYNGEVIYEWYEGIAPGGILIETTTNPQLILQPTPGTHSDYIIVRTENCSSNPSPSAFVEVLEPPVASVDDPLINICQGDNLSLSTSVTGPGFSYEWTGPNGFASNLAQPPAIEDVTSEAGGLYQLVIFNGPCSDTAFSEVIILNTPELPIIESDGVFCEGSSIILTVNNLPTGDQYIWQRNGVTIQIVNTNTLIIPNAQSSMSGDYTVVVKQGLCFSDTSDAEVVIVEDQLIISANNDGPACEGDSIQLTASQIPNAMYAWEGPGGFSSNDQNPKAFALNGEYSVTITTTSGCEASASTQVEVNMAPVVTALSSTASPCMDGNSPVNLVPSVFPPNPDYQYTWTGPLDFNATDSVPTIENFTSANNGLYTVVVNNGFCDSDPVSIQIDVNNIPPMPSIFGNDSYCIGDTFTLETNEAVGNPVQYIWNVPGGQDITSDPFLTIIGATNIDEGVYSVKSIVGNCESELSAPFEIEIIDRPLPVNISSNSPVCDSDTLRLFADFVQNATYEWRGPNGFSSNLQNPVKFPVDKNDAGMYSVRVSIMGCVSAWSLNEIVEILEAPETPSLEPSVDPVCLSDPDASFTVCLTEDSVIEGASYHIYNSNTGQEVGSGTDRCVEINDLSSFIAGNNIIQASTQIGVCRSFFSTPILVEMDSKPNILPDAGDDILLCDEEEAIMNANNFPNLQGNWSSTISGLLFDDPSDPNTDVTGFDPGENLLIWTFSFESCIDYASDTVLVFSEKNTNLSDDTYETSFGESITFDPTQNDDLPLQYSIQAISDPQFGTLEQGGQNTFIFNPGEVFQGQISFIYEICSENCPEICDMAEVIIKVDDESNCIIPSVMTPNNDGYNDRFLIPCLSGDQLPLNELIVFNQWGDQVFRQQPYDNNWDGTYKGESLPAGTYFFIFNPGDGSSPSNGFLIIQY